MITDKLTVRAASLLVPVFAVMIGFIASPEVLAAPAAPVASAMQVQAEPAGETQKIIEETIGQQLEGAGPFTVAITSIIGVFIAPAIVAIIVVWLVFRHKGKREELKFGTLKLMVEKGVPLPENLSFAEPAPAPGTSLRRGLILIALGIGIMVFFLLVNAPQVTGLGAIPFFIGLAYLLIWYLERNQAASSDQG